MDRLTRFATCCIGALLLLIAADARASGEEGDDGADEIPADSRKPAPSIDELRRSYRVFAQDAAQLRFTASAAARSVRVYVRSS